MVSTRGHPKEFPEPDLTPTKTPSTRGRKGIASSSSSTSKWAHTPSNLTILWLLVSVPLVAWDASYVMLRPHSMAGGKWQWPLWMPYDLYAKVDYIYGWPAFESNNGFTAAQTALNIVESLMYVYYLYILYAHGKASPAASSEAPTAGILGRQRSVEGRSGVLALLVGYSAAVMTASKTLLYWANEYYSGFDNIGHNSARDLVFLWIIPNGAWLVLSSYMIYEFGNEILEGLEIAAGSATSSFEDSSLIKAE